MEKYTIESELAQALIRCSYGKYDRETAEKLAAKYAPVLEADKYALAHKSVAYYAREIILNG